MHVISKKKLREFWEVHEQEQASLEAWHKVAEHAEWEKPEDVTATYNDASMVKGFTVFRVSGYCRVIAKIHFNRAKIYIRHVLTHAEYDEGRW